MELGMSYPCSMKMVVGGHILNCPTHHSGDLKETERLVVLHDGNPTKQTSDTHYMHGDITQMNRV